MDEKYDIYVLDTLRGHWNVSQSIDNIFLMYEKWHPSVVGLETVAFQKALKAWLENAMREKGTYFPITELKRSTNEIKEFRIKSLEPFYREGKVYHAPWMKNLELELATFPKGKHDDEEPHEHQARDVEQRLGVPVDLQAADEPVQNPRQKNNLERKGQGG